MPRETLSKNNMTQSTVLPLVRELGHLEALSCEKGRSFSVCRVLSACSDRANSMRLSLDNVRV